MREIREDRPDGWTVVRQIDTDRDGNGAIVRFLIEATDPDMPPSGGITGTLLRGIKLGRVVAQTWSEVLMEPAASGRQTWRSTFQAGDLHDLKLPPRHGGRLDDEFLLKAAAIWDHLVNTSNERSLYRAFIRELHQQGFEYQYEGARDLIERARSREFLERPKKRGKLGGGLTERGKQQLQLLQD